MATGGRCDGRRHAAEVDRVRQEHAGCVLLSADQADRLRQFDRQGPIFV